MTKRGLRRFLDDLAAGRRPRCFRPGVDDVDAIRAAITVKAADPGSGQPSAQFVSGLFDELAGPAGEQPRDPSIPGHAGRQERTPGIPGRPFVSRAEPPASQAARYGSWSRWPRGCNPAAYLPWEAHDREVPMAHRKHALAALILGTAALGAACSSTTKSSNAGAPGAPAGSTSQPAAAATIKVATATVAGQSEQILENSSGMPLYTFAGDTMAASKVSGKLAQFWPPLDSSAPTESGATGKLTVVRTGNGSQVQYNGHFLYTFVTDTPGHVTGQGVQNFFVATPALAPAAASSSPPTTAHQNGGYGY